MVQVRYFDAFPKEENFRLPKVSPSTVVFFMLTLMVLWLETTAFMGAHQDSQFSVHKGVADTFQVNFDITVASPCLQLEVGSSDVSGDRLLMDRLLDIRPLRGDDETAAFFLGSGWASEFGYTPLGPEEEWCRFSGIFNTNRVRGQIFVRAAPWGGRLKASAALNISHGINELSFGPYYPSLHNPLDETAVASASLNQGFFYKLSLVPTTVKGFGVEMVTHQYSVETLPVNPQVLPGVYFEYDFEPISVTLTDSRMSFFQWLFRVANIVGGIKFGVSWYLRHKDDQEPEDIHDEFHEKV